MANRVTAEEVKKIIATSVDDEVVLEHINIANVMVDDLLSTQSGLSSGALRNIELFLAAHITALFDPETGMKTWAQIGQSQDGFGYQKILGEGLKSTRFGQMALALDSTNILQNTGRPKATFRTYGHEPATS